MSGCLFLFISISLLFTSTYVAARIRYIDLSYAYDNNTLTWPSEQKERFRFTKRVRFDSPHYEANSFETAEHLGTHIDAPRHFVAGKYGVAKIPLNDLIGPAVVVNVTEKSNMDADLLIDVADFEIHERKFGRIPDRSIVLLYSGWGKYWPNATAYFGTASNNTSILHFPGLAPAGATWLIQKRKVKAVGIDTGSIDYGQSKDFQSHVILLGQNIPVFENVANLHLVPATGAMVYALPMKIGQGTGAPLRIIASWDTNKTSAGHVKDVPRVLMMFFFFVIFMIII